MGVTLSAFFGFPTLGSALVLRSRDVQPRDLRKIDVPNLVPTILVRKEGILVCSIPSWWSRAFIPLPD